ncbi:MAG: nickel-dependent lactate racemase [Rubripirellula sp.]|nr:nickel-dependent lactate racemase [Rubripirellula sp.]
MNTAASLPRFFPLQQTFESSPVKDVEEVIACTFCESDSLNEVHQGQTVAVAVGSRGIHQLSRIVKAVVQEIKKCGAQPIIVPAMGSHGGATAEGQAAVLASFGVTEESMGCPVVSSMGTVLLGHTPEGLPIYFDRVASEADHIVVVNRVKPHTRLAGQYESGLIKMLMIGLGKHRGASTYHQFFPDYDYCLDRLVPSVVKLLLNRMPITCGLAIVEDAFENTSHLEAVPADEILNREPELLEKAKSLLPRLPFQHFDLLIVDQIGKEISGTGMDTNLIGRKSNDKAAAEDEFPKVRHIYVRSLTSKTAGNGAGIGIAEYCHQRVVDALDVEKTKVNCITSAHPSAGAVPLTFESDCDALLAALSQVAIERHREVKWIWIRDTLHVDRVWVSEAFHALSHGRQDLQVLAAPKELEFDESGDLLSPW